MYATSMVGLGLCHVSFVRINVMVKGELQNMFKTDDHCEKGTENMDLVFSMHVTYLTYLSIKCQIEVIQ